MKKYLLALIIIASLAISCGADATKPDDLRGKEIVKTTTSTSRIERYMTNTHLSLEGTVDDHSVITKIVSVKAEGERRGYYTQNVNYTVEKNEDGIIVGLTINDSSALQKMVEISYEYENYNYSPANIELQTPTISGKFKEHDQFEIEIGKNYDGKIIYFSYELGDIDNFNGGFMSQGSYTQPSKVKSYDGKIEIDTSSHIILKGQGYRIWVFNK